MPGLVGFYSEPVSRETAVPAVERMRDTITHRPFYKKDPVFVEDNLYAARSHINVMQKTPQPSSTNHVYVWLDGEFYNSEELANKSTEHPVDDADLLCEMYHSDPELTFLDQIDGGFSAVIYDQGRNKLHMISDRYCRQHLYWTKVDNGIAWASEIKAFKDLPGFRVDIDPLGVEEFIATGNILGDRTWFKGVYLMPAATVLSFNLNDYSVDFTRYWWWDQLTPFKEPLESKDLAEETGRLLIQAVNRQCKIAEKSIGIALSGGKDSRAILAAIPDDEKPVHAITFGKKNCWDILNAARAAKIKRANHHIYELNAGNWFEERLDSIWWTEGQVNLIHLNAGGSTNEERSLFNNAFIGLGGESISGRSHLYDSDKVDQYLSRKYPENSISGDLFDRIKSYIGSAGPSEIYYFDHRFRNFSAPGLKRGECSGIRTRTPLMSNKLMEFVHKIPSDYKKSAKLYDRMLLMNFPKIFGDLDGRRIGLNVSLKQKGNYYWIKGKKRLKNMLAKTGFFKPITNQFTDYPGWIRTRPASIFVRKVLLGEDAIYPDYIERERVTGCLESHFNGRDNTQELSRFLTFEIWLKQILKAELRSNEEYRFLVDEKT